MFEIQAENRDLTDRDINQPKETHKRGCYLALTFGTLLSSQGTDAQRHRPLRASSMAEVLPYPASEQPPSKGTPRLASRPARRIENHTRSGRAVHRGSSGRQERWLRARGGSRSRR